MSANPQDLLALAGPEGAAVAAGLDISAEVASKASSFAYEVARQAGLTAEDNYAGWIPLLELAYVFLWPPIKTLVQIEYQWYGFIQTLGNYVQGLANAAGAVGNDFANFGHAVASDWDWLAQATGHSPQEIAVEAQNFNHDAAQLWNWITSL